MATSLNGQFAALSQQLNQLISLLEESEDRFWVAYIKRGLKQVDENKLAGATFILGCYGGEDTFSDVVIARHWEKESPLKFHNANARLGQLRNEIFTTASSIASRQHW
jgi:hypothetical protein